MSEHVPDPVVRDPVVEEIGRRVAAAVQDVPERIGSVVEIEAVTHFEGQAPAGGAGFITITFTWAEPGPDDDPNQAPPIRALKVAILNELIDETHRQLAKVHPCQLLNTPPAAREQSLARDQPDSRRAALSPDDRTRTDDPMPTDTPTSPEHAPLDRDPDLVELLNARPWARQLPAGGPSLPGVYEILLDLINATGSEARSDEAMQRAQALIQPHRAALVTIGAHLCDHLADHAGLPDTVGEVFIRTGLAELIAKTRPFGDDAQSPEASDEVFAHAARALLADPDAFTILVNAIVDTTVGIREYEAAAAASE
ncbi:hypothetical protein [Actinomadura sp. SCN-SB]|uniref:hypothetical protein n=1 Tax=Actinomadura sp. SCN-SB TaxID=3373092 RepID=UPI003750EC07